MSKQEKESWIMNCIFVPRESDYQNYPMLDVQKDGSMFVHLDGYAIIPVEEYHKLKKAAGNSNG
jgi:hypothetical protein